jgi:low temperature requirement protein LtrA
MTDSVERTGRTLMTAAVRQWFAPPRAHGEVIEDRTVSFLELFYDLVFVVLISQIAHTLAGDVSWAAFVDFAIVFGLIWIAWANGSLYHELHGREDGRSRTFIFGQMLFLVVLAVYAGHAAGADGQGFALVYAGLLTAIGAQWLGVRRYDDARFAAMTTRYVAGIAIVVVAMLASSLLDSDTRLVLWAVIVVATVGANFVAAATADDVRNAVLTVTDSLSERFGLFTIIVLGEVVVGVADGLAETDRNVVTIATGLFALGIGFGVWWNYFDFVGRRRPRPGGLPRATWLVAHLPLSLGVAATGAGMVSLIEHAGDARTPAATAWLISGSTALTMLSLAVVVGTMPAHDGRRAVPLTLTASAGLAVLLGALRPDPLLLAILLHLLLFAVWIEAFVRHARHRLPIVEPD